MMTLLIPCPFCGGEARVNDSFSGRKIVRCRDCRMRTSPGWESEVVAEWNRRAPVLDVDSAIVLIVNECVTVGKAAELCGLRYFEMEDVLKARGIRWKE